MPLTSQQQVILKAAVEADHALSLLAPSADSAYAIGEAMQAIANPAFIVWKSSVSEDEIMQNGFDWVQVDNLSVGKARIWEWMFDNESRSTNPSKINVRAGIDECWKGTAANLAVRAAVYVHCKRSANRLEKLLATGTGSDASPATMGYEGTVSYQEVLQAMGW